MVQRCHAEYIVVAHARLLQAHAARMQACLRACRSHRQQTSAELPRVDDFAVSRRQALLLGAGTLAASNFALPSTTLADQSSVIAQGIKPAETVELGQSGLLWCSKLHSYLYAVRIPFQLASCACTRVANQSSRCWCVELGR